MLHAQGSIACFLHCTCMQLESRKTKRLQCKGVDLRKPAAAGVECAPVVTDRCPIAPDPG